MPLVYLQVINLVKFLPATTLLRLAIFRKKIRWVKRCLYTARRLWAYVCHPEPIFFLKKNKLLFNKLLISFSENVDLELPSTESVPVLEVSEDAKVIFKEKTVTSLGDAAEEMPVFKKRKFENGKPRNIRQRLSDHWHWGCIVQKSTLRTQGGKQQQQSVLNNFFTRRDCKSVIFLELSVFQTMSRV